MRHQVLIWSRSLRIPRIAGVMLHFRPPLGPEMARLRQPFLVLSPFPFEQAINAYKGVRRIRANQVPVVYVRSLWAHTARSNLLFGKGISHVVQTPPPLLLQRVCEYTSTLR